MDTKKDYRPMNEEMNINEEKKKKKVPVHTRSNSHTLLLLGSYVDGDLLIGRKNIPFHWYFSMSYKNI